MGKIEKIYGLSLCLTQKNEEIANIGKVGLRNSGLHKKLITERKYLKKQINKLIGCSCFQF